MEKEFVRMGYHGCGIFITQIEKYKLENGLTKGIHVLVGNEGGPYEQYDKITPMQYKYDTTFPQPKMWDVFEMRSINNIKDKDAIIDLIKDYESQGFNYKSVVHHVFGVTFFAMKYIIRTGNEHAIHYCLQQGYFRKLNQNKRLELLRFLIIAECNLSRDIIYILFSQVHPKKLIYKVFLNMALWKKILDRDSYKFYVYYLRCFFMHFHFHDEDEKYMNKSRFEFIPEILYVLLVISNDLPKENEDKMLSFYRENNYTANDLIHGDGNDYILCKSKIFYNFIKKI